MTTILRGIRHNNGQIKEPFKSDGSQSAQQRRAIAITLLEALTQLGATLDTKTLREAYDHCNATLTSSFSGLTLKAIRAGAFATLADQTRCDTLLQSVRLTNNEELRDAPGLDRKPYSFRRMMSPKQIRIRDSDDSGRSRTTAVRTADMQFSKHFRL